MDESRPKAAVELDPNFRDHRVDDHKPSHHLTGKRRIAPAKAKVNSYSDIKSDIHWHIGLSASSGGQHVRLVYHTCDARTDFILFHDAIEPQGHTFL